MALAFIASSAASTIIEKLIDMGLSYVEEHQALRGMQEELQRLQQVLPQIQAILAAVEEGRMTERNEGLAAWMWQFRDAVEEAEDVLDALEYYEIEKRVRPRDDKVCGAISELKRKLFSFVGPPSFSSNDDTSKRLRDAVKGLDRVAAGTVPFLQLVSGLVGCGAKRRQFDGMRNSRETSSFLLENEVLGREAERDMIIERLIKPTGDEHESPATANVSAFSLVGIGGMGKTTLAQFIYKNERVKHYFDQTVWVCVSDIFDATVLTSKILQDMTKQSPDVQNLNTLQEILREKLISKRFLLVLDDVWNEDNRAEWEKLVAPLKFGQRGSKILLTTRMHSVADMVATVMERKKEYLWLEGLGESDYMLLFNKHAFANAGPNDHKNLQLIGKQIAAKLRGCPLAAKVLGGLLNSCMDANYWKSILSDNIVNLQQGANGIKEVLKLSYHHLPTDLQLCFRHCSIFPQDHHFRGKELVDMWMSLGFVRQCGKQTPEDIGQEYLTQLTRKSFFDVSSTDVYIMHDLLHDLAQSVSSKECLRSRGDDLRDVSKTIRHLSVETASCLVIREISCLENLRTLILHLKKDNKHYVDHVLMLSEVLKKLKSLRLLCITADYLCKLPDALDALIHLRYLSFRPESPFNKNLQDWFSLSVCRLYHLQVLDISFPEETIENIETNSVMEIKGLSNLVNLRVLNVPHGLMTKIRWIGKLTSLQNLNHYHVRAESGYKIGELKDLTDLRQIYVGNLENVGSSEEAMEAKLNEKGNLSSLSLEWSAGRAGAPEVDEQLLDNLRPHINLQKLFIDGYIGVRYPCWMTDFCLSNLTTVTLHGCSRLEQLPPLGQLPFLRTLGLSRMGAVKRVDWSVYGGADGGAFPSLEVMWVSCMPAWEEWFGAADGCIFPRLKTLDISGCPNLRGLPTLPLSLRHLGIRDVGITAIPAMYRDSSNNNNGAPSSELAPTPSIENCPNLPSIDGFLLRQQEYFQNLNILSIEECKKLVHLPPNWFAKLPSLERLTVRKCPKLMMCEIQDNHLPSTLLRSLSFGSCGGLDVSLLGQLPYLTSLTSLTLHECAITASLPGAQVFARLASLSSLAIWNCKELASLGGMEALASLKHLTVRGCDKLVAVSLLQPPLDADVSREGVVASSLRLVHLEVDRQSLLLLEPLRNLRFTRILSLLSSSQLTSLPEQWLLQNRSSLRCLIIHHATSLQSLPPSMMGLYSLQKLTLFCAPLIQSLPEFPASLSSLKISGCHPVLEERCRKDTGLDWPKIAHIPHVTITQTKNISDSYCFSSDGDFSP